MIIKEDVKFVWVRASPALAEALRERRIFFEVGLDERRLAQGNHVLKANKRSLIEPYACFDAGNTIVSMGSFSYARQALAADMTVGRYCSIGPGFRSPAPRHPIEHVSSSPFTYDGRPAIIEAALRDRGVSGYRFFPNRQKPAPVIGHDVWIGEHVTVMPGVTVGDGAVIAANATVTRDVPPYAVVMGTPAQVVRPRFPARLVEALLALQWWRYHFADFHGLSLDRPEAFIEELSARIADGALQPWQPEPVNFYELARAVA